MTIREALQSRIRFVRMPTWEPSAYIELPLLEDGGHGPWATVHDVSGETKIFVFRLDGSSYEEFHKR